MIEMIRGGCNARHSSSFFMSRPEGLTHYVLLIIRTAVEFQIADKEIVARPGQAVIILPGTPYHYRNPEGEYMDDWLHFQIREEADRKKVQRLANQLLPIKNTEFYTDLIKQILWEDAYAKEGYRQQDINACFTLLINHLQQEYESKGSKREMQPFQEQLQLLRLELQSVFSGDVTIQQCAQRLGISETYFQHLYTKAFGVSFQQDLIRFRIEHAKYLLESTDMTLDLVAEACGYSNEVHFYRQFKQLVHMTPAKYRRLQPLHS